MNRRAFLATAAAGGMVLAWPRLAPAATGTGAIPVGIWATITPDDVVTIRIARSEMGQGTLTGLAQLVADELEADWSRVRTEYVAPEANLASKRAWGDMLTGGSRGIRTSVDYVRQGGAAARTMLIQAAATRWGVPAADCMARESVVRHPASGRTLRYGELAADAAKLPVPKDVPLKDPADWRIIGKPLPRLDTAPKVNGAEIYAIDVRLPGMLQAAIAQSPVFGGKLAKFDAAAVTSMPGVRHVLPVGDNAVAVVADTWWQAKTALEALPVTWDDGPNAAVSSATIAARLREGLDATDAFVGHRIGDAPAALASATRKISADYGTPFLNHATLEPMNCTAQVTGRPRGSLGRHPERRRHAGCGGRGRGRALGQRQGEQIHPGRRLRPARLPGLHEAGRPARQASPRHTREDDLVAGGGHAARVLPPRHHGPHVRGLGRQGQPGRPVHAHQRPEHRRQPAAHTHRHGPRPVPGIAGRGVRLPRHPQPADRPCHAEHPRPRGLLARGEPQPERGLPGVLPR